MLRWAKIFSIFLVGVLGFAVIATWLLLSSSILAKPRGHFIAHLLSEELSQTVEITDGVNVGLGRVLQVTARGVELPSPGMADVTLAKIDQLNFGLQVSELIGGRIKLHTPHIEAAKVVLVVDPEGKTSWGSASSNPVTTDKAEKGVNGTISDFLAERRVQFSNSNVIYQDGKNGLDLDLLLTNLDLSQAGPSTPLAVNADGALNGQKMTLTGNFTKDEPFSIAVNFSQMQLMLDGTPVDEGYEGAIALEVSDLGQLQDVLKLEKAISGTGHVRADYEISADAQRIPKLDVRVDLDGGQSLVVTGDMGQLGDPSDMSVDTFVRLFTDANKPPPTGSRRDLKLIGVDMRLIAQPSGIPKRSMVIETNGFTLDTSGEGPPPIAVSGISRTSDGRLELGNVVLRIGPPEAPFVTLDGGISDALRLQDIDFEAVLELPAASLLAPEHFQDSDALGYVSGGFRLHGSGTELTLSDLNAASRGTDLWNLNVSGSLRNALSFSDAALSVTATVFSGANLLQAIGLDPVETGEVALKADINSLATKWQMEASVAVADSQLDFGGQVDIDDPSPVASGHIESDLIRIAQLRDLIAASLQLKKLTGLEENAKQQEQSTEEASDEVRDIQPLVLNSAKTIAPEETAQSGPIRNVSLQPLGKAILLSGLDLSLAIDLHRIEGEKGASSLHTTLELKDEKAQLGPVKFEYDGAHFDVTGFMDLAENPDVLKLQGSTGGWDLTTILHELKFKKQASGTLYADFEVSGHHSSVRDFLTTLTGPATVSMTGGSIDTQLLDLAGLGVIPWLFSKDKGSAAPIVCMRMPLHASNGQISTKRTVVETDQVQIVVYGDVNIGNMTLDIAGQPRRIGKPLSRSPWPFTLAGALTNPTVKVKDGPRRLARSDGATTMPEQRRKCVPDILQLK